MGNREGKGNGLTLALREAVSDLHGFAPTDARFGSRNVILATHDPKTGKPRHNFEDAGKDCGPIWIWSSPANLC